MLKLGSSFIPGSGIALSIVGGLLKSIVNAPIVYYSPKELRAYWDPETFTFFAIDDYDRMRELRWVECPDLFGTMPPVADAKARARRRHELLAHADSYVYGPLPEVAMEDHRTDESAETDQAETEPLYSHNGNGNGNGNHNGNGNGSRKPSRSKAGRVLVASHD